MFTDMSGPIRIELGKFWVNGKGALNGQQVDLYTTAKQDSIGKANAGQDGAWSIQFDTTPLTPGEHTLYVKGVDPPPAGKASGPERRSPEFRVIVPDGRQPRRPLAMRVVHGRYAESRRPEDIKPDSPLALYGDSAFLRLEGVDAPADPTKMRFFVLRDGKLTEVRNPVCRPDPQVAGGWIAELHLEGCGYKQKMLLVVMSEEKQKHNYGPVPYLPFVVQPVATAKKFAIAGVAAGREENSRPRQPNGFYLLNAVAGASLVDTDLPGDAEVQVVIFREGDPEPLGKEDWSRQKDGRVRVPISGLRQDKQNLRAELVQGDQKVPAPAADPVTVSVRLRGPRVVEVKPPDFGTAPGYTTLTLFFDRADPLDDKSEAIAGANAKDNYVLWASRGTGVFGRSQDEKIVPDAVRYDPEQNTIALQFKPTDIKPDIYRLEVRGAAIRDMFGNALEGVEGKPGSDYAKVLGRAAAAAVAEAPAPGGLPRGIRHTTGENVEFPEYTEPRDPPPGFNPSDHVETRVARLYYFRDAHRVAQIINREVKSYNRAAVDAAEQLADKARADADAATDLRRRQEFLAIEAAKATRRAEAELQQDERALLQARQNEIDAANRIGQIEAELTQKPDNQKLQDELNRLKAGQQDRAAVTGVAAQRVREASTEVQKRREEETRASETLLQAQAKEDRLREDQFRREVAAAHEDPDTYVPGKPKSDDPVRRVSISVIGEGLIQLRGPIKGINIIRMMINQIDAPVGQVRVGIHTVQINGERGDKMEKVADRVQKYIDHSRFLTMQSAEMLRKAVAKVAAQKAVQCGGVTASDGPALNLECSSQDDRDMRYLYSFFGQDFICELKAMDSEFLKTGNKLLSLHSMDTTSLASALFVFALAKNTTRMEILQEFEEMCRGELPAAEMGYFEAGWSPPGKKLEQWFCKEKFPVLACNARFQSLRGMLDGEIEGPETISPIQREFIRLAQIFKSRLVVEMQYRQRIMERAVIEDRLGNRLEELRVAKEREQKGQEALARAKQAFAKARDRVLQLVSRIGGRLEAINRLLNEIAIEQQFYLSIIVERDGKAFATIRGRKFAIGLKTEQNEAVYDMPPQFQEEMKSGFYEELARLNEALSYLELFNFENAASAEKWASATQALAEVNAATKGEKREIAWKTPDNRRRLKETREWFNELYSTDLRKKYEEFKRVASELVAILGEPAPRLPAGYGLVSLLRDGAGRYLREPLKTEVLKLVEDLDREFVSLFDVSYQRARAMEKAEESRRPLDHKKFLDMLVDEMEDKYIELLEGTRAHTANIDAYIKRLVTALDDDFNTQFYLPAFRQVRSASRAWDVNLGQIELTSILANNREFAKVSPQATMEFDLPKRDILITEAMKGAKAAIDEYGALLQDPTFLALTKMGAGLPTSSPPKSYGQDFATVRNVLPGLPGSSAERIVSQSNPGTPEIGAAFEALIPDPAIYKFETGTGYEIRPVIQPDGQAVVFHLNYMYTTNVREPVRADEKHLGRVKRHFIDTDVQLSNYELREVSRYQVALKASRTGRGVPLLENVPVAGVLFRPLPSAESSLQENIILGQATIFPTLFDLMGLRWAPAIADLDPLRVVNDEFIVRGRNRALMNRVFDHSSAKVDEYLRIPEGERRPDLYRSQETIPHEHPDGYRGPGLNLRDSKLEEGLPLRKLRPETPYVPGAHKEGILFRSPDDPPVPSGVNPGQSPPAPPDDSSGGQGGASESGPQLQQGSRAAPAALWQRLANPRTNFARPGEKTR